jgi:hypothetical protein
VKKLAVIQSGYIPWKGFFDLIHTADALILYDHAQYTKGDWRNRNRIKTREGLLWLTIPVIHDSLSQRICDSLTAGHHWREKHWKSICQWYGRSRFFRTYRDVFRDLYLGSREERLSLVNHAFIAAVNEILGIRTPISWSMDYSLADDRTERLIGLCRQAGADEYLSGPSARNYIDEDLFAKNNIRLTYMDFDGYQEYPQTFPPFEHKVSVIDLIFHAGPDAPAYMKSF